MSNDYPNNPGFGSGGSFPGSSFPGGQYPGAGFGAAPGNNPFPTPAPASKKSKKNKGAAKEKTATRRSVSSMRWLFFGFAAIASLLGVLLVTTENSVTWVARAKADIGAFKQISETDIEIVGLDPAAVEPDTFTGLTEQEALDAALEGIAEKWTSKPISAKQQLRSTALTVAGTFTAQLAADERLISISAQANRAVAGTIKIGDRVDVYATTDDGLTGVLGQDVEVIAISIPADAFNSAAQQQLSEPEKNLEDYVPADPIPGTYVLRIKVADAARYIAADVSGVLYLSLRGAGAVSPENVLPSDLTDALCADPAAKASSACQRVIGPETVG